jgi:hypothetical protein
MTINSLQASLTFFGLLWLVPTVIIVIADYLVERTKK